MKTKIHRQLAVLFVSMVLLASWQVTAQSDSAKPVNSLPSLNGGGTRFSADSAYRLATNSYPYTRIAGDMEESEMQLYFTQISEHKIIPEIMPTAQDTNGNWGMPTDGMQLSLRFHQSEFFQGERVPAYLILRNLSSTSRKWLRNALPDNGYQFTLRRGTNINTWMRPQQKYVPPSYIIGGREEGDPYWYSAEHKTEGLTILYLNRFFDLNDPGQYLLQVQIRVPTLDGKIQTNVISGVATFCIVRKGVTH